MPRDSGAKKKRRRICFVTGTRAEFGLMRPVLTAIQQSKKLQLQIVVTGMHLDPRHGQSLRRVGDEGWRIDAVVPWIGKSQAIATGNAIASLAKTFGKLKPDIVLIVGDRVEAFAAASAAHLCGICVAHVHGGDRAMGQVDDSLRHAITKLSHIHFPATDGSARRIEKLGEEKWRIHRVGSPGIDGIRKAAASQMDVANAFGGLTLGPFALLVLHPVDANDQLEFDRANLVLNALLNSPIYGIIIIYPNNDPGSAGIIRAWKRAASKRFDRILAWPDVDRAIFLGLLREAAMLIGNSSAGIIEAASFGTPVIDIGPRQLGRERGGNVRSVPYRESNIRKAILQILGRPRVAKRNIYERPHTGLRTARILERLVIDRKLLRKLISY
jgi:GDP/UDP-N,N'-diacetylbacillosamine 2-epimerase (hydrolysing)